jgi:hypothetical protein
MPVGGTWIGFPSDALGTTVEVEVTAEPAARRLILPGNRRRLGEVIARHAADRLLRETVISCGCSKPAGAIGSLRSFSLSVS